MVSSALIAGGGNKNEGSDFYPTPPEVTHALMRFLNLMPRVIWEPACGDGAMAEVIKKYGHSVLASDIRAAGYGEPKVDFLSADKNCAAIITNPPFGLAAEFILHALGQAPTVAMLLKAHFWHAQSRTTLFEEHRPAWVLPLNWRPNFLDKRGKSPTMDFQWTVWLQDQKETRYRILRRSDGPSKP